MHAARIMRTNGMRSAGSPAIEIGNLTKKYNMIKEFAIKPINMFLYE